MRLVTEGGRKPKMVVNLKNSQGRYFNKGRVKHIVLHFGIEEIKKIYTADLNKK